MPEGPEIKFLSLWLNNQLKGKTLKEIKEIDGDDELKVPKKSKVMEITAKGKQLTIITKDYWVNLHMNISGWINEKKQKHAKYKLVFSNNKKIYVIDPRKFSKIIIKKSLEEQEKIYEKIGIDIFSEDFTYQNFSEIIGNCKGNISYLLMNQSKIAGIGNYLRNEALYLSRIHPEKKCNTLTKNDILKLYEKIKMVAFSKLFTHLKDSEIKITKELDEKKPNGLSIPYYFKVYQKENDSEGRKIETKKIGGRTAFIIKSEEYYQ
jgi:formamidopyrimidine-DNA glycosylase